MIFQKGVVVFSESRFHLRSIFLWYLPSPSSWLPTVLDGSPQMFAPLNHHLIQGEMWWREWWNIINSFYQVKYFTFNIFFLMCDHINTLPSFLPGSWKEPVRESPWSVLEAWTKNYEMFLDVIEGREGGEAFVLWIMLSTESLRGCNVLVKSKSSCI